ncbi:pyruvate kinase [Bacillus licheniformis]|nr:pyruvate kinase [Bacillus licheniformis]
MEAGMNVARLNFSHGDFEEHGARIKTFVKQPASWEKISASFLTRKGLKSARTQWKRFDRTGSGFSADRFNGRSHRYA